MAISLHIGFNEKGMDKIKDPSKVMMIRPIKEGANMWMRAIIKTGEGEYEAVDVTYPQWFMEFPFEPILSLQFYLGKFYFDNFLIDDNMRALNKEQFIGFCSANYENNPNRIAICANFKDGSSAIYQQQKEKYFNKKGIFELRKFLKNNGLEPRYGTGSDIYDTVIDRFLNSNGKAVIPALKSSSSESKTTNHQTPSVM